MKFSIILCHWKTGMMTAFTISQILKHKGRYDVDILVLNNNAGDGSEKYLEPFMDKVNYFEYPKDKLQSHGVGYDVLVNLIKNEYFICLESDSFPTHNWLDYYERLIQDRYDCAGSLLKLSGGTYIHPAGALYRRTIWQEAMDYCNQTQYHYFPNMCRFEGFDFHTMVHKSISNAVLSSPEDYMELAEGYKPYFPQKAEQKAIHYLPVVGPFHNGMGRYNESIKTYGLRNMGSGEIDVMLDNKQKLIRRVGAEPGQWFSYWQKAMGYKIFEIPTDVHWLPGKENQQQEKTVMENGLTHLWGISAYHNTTLNDEDVAKVKQSLPEQLYNSLPEHQKIKDGN
jgi:hypothetical protein